MIKPKRKKQFIAGVVCPKCSEMDSFVLYQENQDIECVSCGFKQNANQRDEQTMSNEPTKPNKNIDSNQSIKITNLTD